MTIKSVSAATSVAFGIPITRTLALDTAYQASDALHPAVLSINLTSVASITLVGGGTINTADILIGATSAVASGTGTVIGKYRNTISGVVVLGVGINTDSASQIQFVLPIAWFFAVRQTAGTVVITSAFDQSVAP